MQHIELYRGLFAYGRGSLAWLRMFCEEDRSCSALIVEPADNPGRSAVNGAEALIDQLQETFVGTSSIRTFVAIDDRQMRPTWTEVVSEVDDIRFEARSPQEMEALVGLEASRHADSGATCAQLAGADAPLLAMIPAPEEVPNPLRDLRVIAVADLPWAHNPFKCAHRARFDALAKAYPVGERERPAIGAQWFLSLTDNDFSSCDRHAADWKRIAATAVEVLNGLSAEPTPDEVSEAIAAVLGGTPEAAWCESLFLDPITCNPRDDSVGDGQHRACALRASGAPFCIVDNHGDYVPQPISGHPRRRAAADIATFWAQRSAAS